MISISGHSSPDSGAPSLGMLQDFPFLAGLNSSTSQILYFRSWMRFVRSVHVVPLVLGGRHGRLCNTGPPFSGYSSGTDSLRSTISRIPTVSQSYFNDRGYSSPPNSRVMATVARYIRSHYDPETEREDLLLETGQTRASTSFGYGHVHGGIGFTSDGEEGGRNVDDGDEEEEVDPWVVELPYAPAKFNPPLKFVKSVLSYEDVNDYIERGYESGLLGRDEERDKDVEEEKKGISSWYRNLSRTNVSTPAPTPVPETSMVGERTARTGTLNYPVPLSGATDGSVTTITQHASEQPPTSNPPSRPLEPQPRPTTNSRRRSDWFISNVLSHSPSTTSDPGSPAPGRRPPPTLADMLARDPPPNKLQDAYTPPTWIMLPPSNRGFRMLQKSGWSEGEPLGPYFTRRQDAVQIEQQPAAGPSNLGKRKVAQETRTTEIEVEGYDDIVEIKRGQVIDLTVSDDAESVSSSDEKVSDDDVMELDDEIPQSLDLPSENSNPASARPSPPQGEGHGGKALLTPLPTVLKSDRLGIGLKAKTVGPYKASQKRVTHNAAALAAHVKANEERRLLKQKVGRGSRGFARTEKSESEKRKNLLAYLNQ